MHRMRAGSSFARRTLWVWCVGLVALGFWLAGLGCGWRGVLLTDPDRGIVAKAQGFGDAAFVWWVPASVLTGVLAVLGVGVAVIRCLVDGPQAPLSSSTEDDPEPATQEPIPTASTVD